MGLFNLSRLCLAVLFASAITPALAADPPVPRSNVSVTVNPTTGYYSSTNSTVRLPSGVSVSPSTGLPVVSKYSGGLKQTIPTGITIDAIKKSAPLPVVVRSTTQSVKAAAGRCLKSGRCNVALMLAGEGLNRFLGGLDWVMGEGGKVQKLSNDGSAFFVEDPSTIPGATFDPTTYCQALPGGYTIGSCPDGRPRSCISPGSWLPTFAGHGVHPQSGGPGCYWVNYSYDLPFPSNPVPDLDIDSVVDSSYVPEPSDWRALTPEMQPDDIEITSAPTLQGEPKVTTVYDADGVPHEIKETNIFYDFDIRNNKSSQPALDMKTREETKTYENGVLTGTTTTESTASGGSGGGGSSSLEIDIPTDCDFHPTICAWIDWTKKDDDIGEEVDLRQLLHEEDYEKTNTVSFGSKSCPEPLLINLSVVDSSYELSFQPICTLAEYMYYFIMAASYIFAAYIALGISRNG